MLVINYYIFLKRNKLIKNNKGLFTIANYGDNKNKAMEFTLELMNTENINGSVAVLNLPAGLTKVKSEFYGINKIYLDKQNNVDIKYIEEKLKELTATLNLKVVVIDYETIGTSEEDYSEISNKLKTLSEELNILIFVFPKISNNDRENIQMKDLDYRRITDSADVVMLVTGEVFKYISLRIS